jgi:hypothetical protein
MNRCPACGSNNTQEMHDFNRECLDCREVFDPTMDNGDMDAHEQWLPDDPEYHETFDLVDRYVALDDGDLDASEAEWERDWEDNMTDVEADADTLASAGWGIDEDYGCYGGEDY